VESKRAVIEFARQVLRAEFLTPGGVINLVGVFTTFVLTLAVGLADLAQVVIRTWDSHYETGIPSILWFLGGHLLLILVCTVIVMLLYEKPR
jgi:hypothetical protein